MEFESINKGYATLEKSPNETYIQAWKTWKSTFDTQDFSVEYVDFLSNAAEDLVEDPDGEFFLKIVEAGDGNRHDHYIGFGEIVNIHNVLFTLNNPTDGAINIEWDQANDRYTIYSPFGGTSMQMATQTLEEVPVDTQLSLRFRSLYSLAGMQFVFPDPVIQGSYQIVKDEESFQDALTLKIIIEGESCCHSRPFEMQTPIEPVSLTSRNLNASYQTKTTG